MSNTTSKSLSQGMSKTFLTLAMSVALSIGMSACAEKPQADTESAAATNQNSTDAKASETASNNATAENAETIVLRFSHFLPAPSFINKEVFEPWAKQVEEKSNGRLKIEIYPGATLTKTAHTYEATAKGAVDIGLQLHGAVNGRFPLVEIAELPGLTTTASQTSCMLQKLLDDGVYDKEYADTHVLMMFGSAPGIIHTKNKLIKKPEDMAGLRIRRPSAVPGDIIENMGGSPVGIPAPDIYTSLERGVVDGVAIPWDAFNIFRLNEIANKHTNIPFYTSSMVVTMNQEKYDSLPDDLKKLLDETTGSKLSKELSAVMDSYVQAGYEAAKAKGDEIIDIPDPLNNPDWSEPLMQGTQKYLDAIKAKGLDSEGVYEKTKAAAKACEPTS